MTKDGRPASSNKTGLNNVPGSRSGDMHSAGAVKRFRKLSQPKESILQPDFWGMVETIEAGNKSGQ